MKQVRLILKYKNRYVMRREIEENFNYSLFKYIESELYGASLPVSQANDIIRMEVIERAEGAPPRTYDYAVDLIK